MAPQKGGQAIKQKQHNINHQAAVAPAAASANGASPAPAVSGGVNGAATGASQPHQPKKQFPTAARPAVVPAIPLQYVNRQASRQHLQPQPQKPQTQQQRDAAKSQQQNHHQRRPSTNGAPAAQSANGYPVPSLEAALIDHHAAAPDSALALQKAAHRKNMSASGNESAPNGAGVEKAGGAATAAHAHNRNNTASATANGATNGASPRGHENTNGHKKGSRGRNNSVVNGTKHQAPSQNGRGDAKQHKRNQSSSHNNGPANGIGNLTFGDVPSDIHAPDTPARTRSSSLVQASVAPAAANDPEKTPLALSNGSAPHNPQQQQQQQQHPVAPYHPSELSSPTSAFDSQPQSATYPTNDFVPHAPVNGHHLHEAHHRLAMDHGSDPAGFHPAPPLRPHPTSNGAILFGGMGFPDSHSPSPAPPAAAGFMPPPNGHHRNGVNGGESGQAFPPTNGFHAHGHGHAHTDSSATNFPGRPAAFRHDMGPLSTSMDSYSQVQAPAPLPHGPYDGYPPNMGRYGPPTPHSFQGSQASGDQNGNENGPHFLPPNGHGGYGNHGPHPSHPPGLPHAMGHGHFQPPFMAPGHFGGRPSMMAEDLADSVAYFRSQFNSAELADCVLELVFPDRRQDPVKIKGHKLILARSPYLMNSIMLLRAQDPGSHTISIQSEDMWLRRADAWYTAVQRLYLGPLLPVPPPMGNSLSSPEQAGRHADQFNFALAYAAAGHLLQMQDVLVRGLEIAAAMINWNTVEEGLAFALENSHQRFMDDDSDMPDEEYGYGRETELLMSSMVGFLINAFPANFELDTSVFDPPAFARLPAIPQPTHYQKTAPAIARGSSVRQSTNAKAKPTRLSSIKFGDLPTAYPEEDAASPREPAKCSPQLSRILLNLPFHTLRYVLTSESNGISGWNTAQDRYHAVADVVAEREVRRQRAVQAVRDGSVHGAEDIQRRLSSPQRHTVVDVWDSLNWQEEVVQPSGAGVPRLVRRWVPQFSVASAGDGEEAQSYEAQPYESMV